MITKIPILTFHSIDTSGSVISMAPLRFKKLLNKLKHKGYQTINLNELVQWIFGEISFQSPKVVITFDDGFENIYHHAFPVLEETNFQATVFLTTGYCGKKNDWPGQISGVPILPMLNWDQIKEMTQFQFDFQAHTQTHPFLFKLSPEQAKKELLNSKIEIEQRLGTEVDFFAYPYGFFNKGEDLLVRQYFKGACATLLDIVSPQNDHYLLPRIDMYYSSKKLTKNLFFSPVFIPYLQVRKYLRLMRNHYLFYNEKVSGIAG